MLGKVCHFMLGIFSSNVSKTRLELENIILSHIIILCVFVIAFLGISRFNHGGIRSHHIAKHLYSKCFSIHGGIRSHHIAKHLYSKCFSIRGGIRSHHIAKHLYSKCFSIHGGIRSHHIVKHLQLSVKGLYILA